MGRGCWEMHIFKEYPPRWFLCRLKLESYCCKAKVFLENSLPLAHRASECRTHARLHCHLVAEAAAGAEARRTRRVTERTQLLQGSYQGERVANFLQNSLTSTVELTLEASAMAVEERGAKGLWTSVSKKRLSCQSKTNPVIFITSISQEMQPRAVASLSFTQGGHWAQWEGIVWFDFLWSERAESATHVFNYLPAMLSSVHAKCLPVLTRERKCW